MIGHRITEAGLAALGDHRPALLRRAADGLRCGRVDPDTGEVDPEIALTLVNAIKLAELYDHAAATWPDVPAAVRDALGRLALGGEAVTR